MWVFVMFGYIDDMLYIYVALYVLLMISLSVIGLLFKWD